MADYGISPKAFREIFAITSSFYDFLIHEEYTQINPVRHVKQKSRYLQKQQSQPKIRRLSNQQWAKVLDIAENMALEAPQRHARTLFILQALYGMYLRISELVACERWVPQMGDFARDNEGNWWFTTVGKGNKKREISVSLAMLRAFKDYRKALGLTALPSPNDPTPLIAKHRGQGPITDTRYVRRMIQQVFDKAIEQFNVEKCYEDAQQLAQATVHWLRHTGISEDVKIRPREHVRDDAGHGSSMITDRYIDVERHDRARTAKKKVIRHGEAT